MQSLKEYHRDSPDKANDIFLSRTCLSRVILDFTIGYLIGRESFHASQKRIE